MRPWAEWTARTAAVAVGLAAVGGGLSGVALAGTGGGSGSGTISVLSGNQVNAPASAAADVCGAAAAVLGFSAAGCQGGAATGTSGAGISGPGTSGAGPSGAGTSSTGTGGSVGRSGSVTGNQNLSAGSGNTVSVPVSLPVSVCGDAVAVLGDAAAGCAGGASTETRTATAAASAVTGSGAATGGPLAGLKPVSGMTPVPVTATGGTAGSAGTSGQQAGTAGATASRTGSTNQTSYADPGLGGPSTASAGQLAGLGELPGLADLPSLAGLANVPALNGVTEGSVPMPSTALSAVSSSGMNSNSFAALAVGALLAGASALKIAGRRSRDRKAGIGVTI